MGLLPLLAQAHEQGVGLQAQYLEPHLRPLWDVRIVVCDSAQCTTALTSVIMCFDLVKENLILHYICYVSLII